MKKIALPLALLILCGLTAADLPSRQKKSTAYTTPLQRPQAPADFFGKPEEYLDWQARNLLDMVDVIQARFEPRLLEPIERHMAMLMLDAVFHDVKAPERPAVQEFFKARTEQAVKEMESTRVDEGAMFWKLYNMGFVVRTNSITVGFDLIRGGFIRDKGCSLDNELMTRIIDQCDAHFLSHQHLDHVDMWVCQTFIDQGKPVVAPPDFWEDQPIFKHITHLERKAHTVQSLPIQAGKRNLEVVIYPGHQGTKALDNVTLVLSPEGISFCQTGDQSNEDDFAWIDEVGRHHRVDVLMPNCWTRNPARTARGFNPELIIPAHENELGHPIDHREAYVLDYSRWRVPYAKLIMAWGESYHYLPRSR
jgi:L-ascorbate metabolism protein UlaG (beta-lactamase superfamily)